MKKKEYNQPVVEQMQVQTCSMIMAGSPDLNIGVPIPGAGGD